MREISLTMAHMFRRILVLALALTAARPAAAQQRSRTLPGAPKPNPAAQHAGPAMGTIDGVVTDSALVPIAGAEVGILRTAFKITTNAEGRFRITDVQMGSYILMLRRFGYSPVASVVSVNAGDTLKVMYSLQKLATGRLDTVRITERRVSVNLVDFERRRRLGVGRFMTEADIEKRGSIDVGTLLRSFNEVVVVRDDNSGVTSLQSRRDQGNMIKAQGAGACATQVIVDNIPMPHSVDVELLPRPKEIAGIEVYGGPSGAPSEYGGSDRACGMVLIWTKDGTRAPRK